MVYFSSARYRNSTHASRKKSTSSLIAYLKWVLVFVCVVFFVGVGVYKGILRVFSVLDNNKNILFVFNDSDGYSKINYIAHFDKDEPKKTFFREIVLPNVISKNASREEQSTFLTRISYEKNIVIEKIVWLPEEKVEDSKNLTLQKLLQYLIEAEWNAKKMTAETRQLYLYTLSLPEESNRLVTHDQTGEMQALLLEEAQSTACSVAFINTTTAPGLANTVSQVFEKNGGHVIRVASQDTVTEKTVIFYDPQTPECSPVVNVLQVLVSPSAEAKTDGLQTLNEYRAKVVVLLGEDTRQLYEDIIPRH